jgi:ribonuclease T2
MFKPVQLKPVQLKPVQFRPVQFRPARFKPVQFKAVWFKSVVISAVMLAGIITLPTPAEARTPIARPQPARQQTLDVAGQFDYYLLALSWSPDYCAVKGSSDPQQCGGGKQLGFVLHGLWPQYTRGYPQSCTTEPFDPQMRQQFPNLYPSPKLYSHEWIKHGTCSGLTQSQYHQFAKALKDSVKIPTRYQRPRQPFRITATDLKRDFVQANPGFTGNGIAPSCSGAGRFLQEVLVCHTKDGQPGVCSAEVLQRSQKSCRQPNFLVRSVR